MKKTSADCEPLSARLLAEVIHTPAARALASELLQPLSADEAAALTRTLVTGDPELGLRGLGSLPGLANGALGALNALADSLERLPPALLAQAATQLAAGLDREALLATANRWARLLQRLVDDDELRAAAARALGQLDSGALRQAVERISARAVATLHPAVERVVQDPVLVANLVQCAPPLANAALGLSAHAVASLRLPAEVLASALFNLLDALDAAALARLLDGLSGLLVGAHEGSLIIGRHEPQLRQVLARRMLDVASRLDRDRLGRTAAALAEDVETVLRAGADLLQAEPELLLLGLSSALYTLEAALRGLSHGVERLASLPLATREQLDRELRQGLDRLRQQLRQSPTLAALPGRMVAAGLGLARRELDRVDAESAGRALGQGLTAAAELVANRPELLNAALADLDRPQARNALERAVAQLTAGFTARPQLLRALLGPLVSGAQHAALDYLRTLPGRLRRRSR